MSERKIRGLNTFHPRTRVKMDVVVKRLGQKDDSVHEWLVLTPRDQLPQPEKEAWPRPEKRPDGSYIYDRSVYSYKSLNHATTATATGGSAAAAAADPRKPLTELSTAELYVAMQTYARQVQQLRSVMAKTAKQ